MKLFVLYTYFFFLLKQGNSERNISVIYIENRNNTSPPIVDNKRKAISLLLEIIKNKKIKSQ